MPEMVVPSYVLVHTYSRKTEFVSFITVQSYDVRNSWSILWPGGRIPSFIHVSTVLLCYGTRHSSITVTSLLLTSYYEMLYAWRAYLQIKSQTCDIIKLIQDMCDDLCIISFAYHLQMNVLSITPFNASGRILIWWWHEYIITVKSVRSQRRNPFGRLHIVVWWCVVCVMVRYNPVGYTWQKKTMRKYDRVFRKDNTTVKLLRNVIPYRRHVWNIYHLSIERNEIFRW